MQNKQKYNKINTAISNIDCPDRLVTLAENFKNCVAKIVI